ncbi:O-antigen ligase family protein [Flavobacteriaceae bacterium]|nr:O-antigen ligase family protein [Flavobacteriaceae bacterium]
MKSSSINFTSSILIILYILTGTLPNLNAIDILAPQWVYLCSLNILVALHLLSNKDSFASFFSVLSKSTYFIFYAFFILWAALSFSYAINKAETIINFPRYFNVFVAITFVTVLLSKMPNRFHFISVVLTSFLFLEVTLYYNQFVEQITSSNVFNSIALKGFSGNKNIAAASMVVKLPFALYLLTTLEKLWVKIVLFILLTLSYIALTIIYARAALLSSTLIMILFVVYQVYVFFFKGRSFKKLISHSAFILLPFLVAFFSSEILSSSLNTRSYADRVETIGLTRQASSGRFNYWESAFESFVDNPIIGSGLGNFKIKSISYGADYIHGYTVPYHAHNDFIHTATELGVFGFIAYFGSFLLLALYLVQLFRKSSSQKQLGIVLLFLALVGYGMDAFFNFPVARPLMQSALALIVALIVSEYLDLTNPLLNTNPSKGVNRKYIVSISLITIFLIPSLIVHVISYHALTQQGALLYEFNNGKYNMTLAQLDEISNDFPNLTETAMPIKTMKARYFYNNGLKDQAYDLIRGGMKDNPYIRFNENLLAQFYFNDKQYDSSYHYAKIAFDNIPNNMPHFNLYMQNLAVKRDRDAMIAAYDRVLPIVRGDTKTARTIFLRSIGQISNVGDPYTLQKAEEAFKLYPDDDQFFELYRIFTYGQQNIVQAKALYKEATEFYGQKKFEEAAASFVKALDLDSLDLTYALNAGLSFYEAKDFENAIRYLKVTETSHKDSHREKAIRYLALSYYASGQQPQACAQFIRLKDQFPKRMYEQEFQKYCLGK